MAYADTDFFLALIKKDDWLKTNAEKILEKYRGQISTGIPTLVELAFLSDEFGLNMEKIFAFVFEVSSVDEISLQECLQVADYIQTEKMSPVDAFQAVLSRDRPIISSDLKYDKIGLQRIKLEK